MMNELEQVRERWNEQAEEWNRWIGDYGDVNRRESSDIYLWKYIDQLENQIVLDAGCGNGYLTIKFALDTRAARIFAVDLSPKMIEIARSNIERRIERVEDRQRIVLNEDSIEELKTIEDKSIDLIVSNYVVMDTPDLDAVVRAFSRVLRTSGRVIIVILHPCFDFVPEKDGPNRLYRWTKSYFDQTPEKQEWARFSLNLYHRPLSIYFQAFHRHGLNLIDFDEPKFFSSIHQYDCTCAAIFHLKKID